MATTQTQLKAVSDGQNTTNEMPDVRRSEVAQMIPLPGIEQVEESAEWQEMADVVRDDNGAGCYPASIGAGLVEVQDRLAAGYRERRARS